MLEHIADPVRVLGNVRRALRPGAGAVITVTAYPFLHGDWDRSLGHHRRYTVRLLREQAAAADLERALEFTPDADASEMLRNRIEALRRCAGPLH